MSNDHPTRATSGGRAYLDLQSMARKSGRNAEELMRLYTLEGLLARLSISQYSVPASGELAFVIVGQTREQPRQCGEFVPFVPLRPPRFLDVFLTVGQKWQISPRMAHDHRNARQPWVANRNIKGVLPPFAAVARVVPRLDPQSWPSRSYGRRAFHGIRASGQGFRRELGELLAGPARSGNKCAICPAPGVLESLGHSSLPDLVDQPG